MQSVLETIQNNMVPFLKYVAIIIVIGIVLTCIYIPVVTSRTLSTPENVANQIVKQKARVDTNLSQFYTGRSSAPAFIEPLENCFINYSPLSVSNTGFLGPRKDGVFSEKDAVTMALKAGARCFTLHIDSHDYETVLDTTLFGNPGDPVLLYRDESDVIRSINSGSIRKVAQTLADLAFGNLINNNTDPLIVILYFVNTPSSSSNEYVPFLSKVAEQLEPLFKYHLGQTPSGDYHRQSKQNDLFYEPITSFQNKVLFFANVDTSIFRTIKPSPPPTRDLDYLVNVSIFKDSTNYLGETPSVTSNVNPQSIIDTVDYFTSFPSDNLTDIVNKSKIRWTIAFPSPGRNPSFKTVWYLKNRLGIQCIPLYICEEGSFTSPDASDKLALPTEFTPSTTPNSGIANALSLGPEIPDYTNENQLGLILKKIWNDKSYIHKFKSTRFIKPSPFTPATPSPRQNAQGGNVAVPT